MVILMANTGPVFLLFFPLASFVYICGSVVMPSEENYPDNDRNYGFSYTFHQCLRNEHGHSIGHVLPCFNKGALAGLMDASEHESVEISHGVTLIKDLNDKSPKTVVTPDMDTTDYRNVLEATAELIARRSLRWDMSLIHPGLFMKVGPMVNGAGVMEFVIERGYPTYNDRTAGTDEAKEISTRGLILRHILVPLLLGFKLKLITLIPLLIGVVIIVSKKALLLSKLAVFVTTVLGLNSLLFLEQPQQSHLQNTFGDSFGPLGPQTFSHHNKDSLHQYEGQFDDFREPVYRERDRIGNIMEPKGSRNFVWEETDKS